MAESTVAMPETEQTQAVTPPETPAVEAPVRGSSI